MSYSLAWAVLSPLDGTINQVFRKGRLPRSKFRGDKNQSENFYLDLDTRIPPKIPSRQMTVELTKRNYMTPKILLAILPR